MTPIAVIYSLAMEGDQETKLSIAEDMKTPSDILEKMAEAEVHKGEKISSALAQNPNMTLRGLTILSKTQCYFTKLYLCKNKKTPLEALHNLSKDSIHTNIRQAAMNHPNYKEKPEKGPINWDGILSDMKDRLNFKKGEFPIMIDQDGEICICTKFYLWDDGTIYDAPERKKDDV